jgi:integrase
VQTAIMEARRSGPAMPTTTNTPAVRGPRVEEQTHLVMQRDPRPSLPRPTEVVEEKKQPQQSAVSTRTTVLRADEIADLKRFHDNSLAASTRRAYQSDYDSFVSFLLERFPRLSIENMHQQCTLEHVLAYLNQLCNEKKTISTINRRLSTMKKHILPTLFTKALVPGSRDEQMMREVDTIVRGIRRTVGAEQRIRGKSPLLIEDIREMADAAAQATDEDDNTMPNKRCRDVALLLFLWHSAMRRNEVAHLLWSDLTFDKRGVFVVIRKSKTDQESKSQSIALPRLDHAHCPVAALEEWKSKSRGEGESPVFRWISKKDEIEWRVLIDQRIVAIIKHYCAEIGHDPACFAAHSARSGYVTSSSERGVPISELLKRTRHRAASSLTVYMKSDDLFNNAGDARL